MKLTREDRKAIFKGDYRALRRKVKPEANEGEKIVLSWSRGGKQFVGRSHEERYETQGETVEVPRKPTVWVEIGETTTKIEDGETVYLIQFKAYDEREHTRTLAPPPSPPREVGLKTRWNQSVDAEGKVSTRRPPPKGHQVESLTDESARGYGGGGSATVDEREGVDDLTLGEFIAQITEENEKRQQGNYAAAEMLREERVEAKERRKGNLSGANAAKRRKERAERRAIDSATFPSD